ncbi:hypothetical protein PHPALM_32043 [Phytophthora palmivora]|uniref:RxLR effector n=1 Tax=Phytophthora palmivora TaxID=4796 RepID=A0A2P4X125_9STRA|nr:hypothetical protein PHPALM_32043 [Phytophthora palmivora]
MRIDLVLLIMVGFLASADALSATYLPDTVSHGTNLVRSLRFNDENYSVVGGKALIDAEERVNFISALLSKISEKIPVNVKLTLWELSRARE